MDKNEQSLIIEEFKTAMHDRDFSKATQIADELEIKKIKDHNFINLIADAYEVNHQYQAAKKVLLFAYENTNAGRHLAYRLCLIAVKTKEFNEAEEFYEDFVDIAPRDTRRYILQYRIAKAKDEPCEKLIEILEEYVNIDMEEQWAYELAKLYHKVGDEDKCIEMCDEICLWFAEGTYVVKALELKKLHRPLSDAQNKTYKINKQKSRDINQVEKNKQKEDIKKDIKKDIKQEIKEDAKEDIKKEDHSTISLDNVSGVENILKQLQKRGILKAETVNQAVDIIENANGIDEELNEDYKTINNQKENKEIKEAKEPDKELKDKVQESVQINTGMQVKTVVPTTLRKPKLEKKREERVEELDLLSNKEQDSLEITQKIPSVNIHKESIKNTQSLEQEYKAKNTNPPLTELEELEELEELQDILEPVDEENISENKRENISESSKSIMETKVISETDINKAKKNNIKSCINKSRNQDKKPVPKAEDLDRINTPVFDLSFNGVNSTVDSDIDQSEIYQNIVSKSELGNRTDQLPDKNEINAAIKLAEQAAKNKDIPKEEMKKEVEKNTQANNENSTIKQLHINEQKNVQVEIMAGKTVDKPFYVIPKEESLSDEEGNTQENVILEKPDLSIIDSELRKDE